MRIISLIFIIVLIMACNNSAKKKEETKDTTAQNIPVTPAPQQQANDTIFRGLGTEPFWSVFVINNDKILYQPADGPDIAVPYVPPSSPDAITTKYNSSNDSITMELTIKKMNCSDGMSDNLHPFQVTLLINAIRLSGCGREL